VPTVIDVIVVIDGIVATINVIADSAMG